MKDGYTRLGIFGGTFNPIHLGHLRLAEDVREKFCLDRVIFVPTNIPPHKNMEVWIDPLDRLRMVEMALSGNEGFSCEDVEIKRGGLSYTIDTVDYIYENYQFEGRPFFIVGSDLIGEIHTWKYVQSLAEKVHFIVILRDKYPIAGDGAGYIKGLHLHYFKKRNIDITSSEIRERVKMGKSIRWLVTEEVFHYINEKGLYR